MYFSVLEDERSKIKPFTGRFSVCLVYVSWFTDGTVSLCLCRVGREAKLCLDCFTKKIIPFMTALPQESLPTPPLTTTQWWLDFQHMNYRGYSHRHWQHDTEDTRRFCGHLCNVRENHRECCCVMYHSKQWSVFYCAGTQGLGALSSVTGMIAFDLLPWIDIYLVHTVWYNLPLPTSVDT